MTASVRMILVVVGLGACGIFLWLSFGPHITVEQEIGKSVRSDFFKPAKDLKTDGGQQMKPRW